MPLSYGGKRNNLCLAIRGGFEMNIHDEMFCAFWAAYPRRVGKGAAKTEFMKALKRAPFETIMNGLLAQLPANLKRDDPKFIPHARTWLHQSRWDDDIEWPKQRTGIIGAAMRSMGNEGRNQGAYSNHVQRLLSVSKH